MLERLARRALLVGRTTASAFFRVIHAEQPTLLIDEADAFLRENETMRGLIDSGHDRASATTMVSTPAGDNWQPTSFSTFAAVALASIGELPDTIENRSIVINMRRRRPDDPQTLRARRRILREHLDPLNKRCADWCGLNAELVRAIVLWLPEGLRDRIADNWEPLFAIAEAAGGSWPLRAWQAALMLSREEQEQPYSMIQLLLSDLRAIFRRLNAEFLPSTEICRCLIELEDRPWADSFSGGPITTHRLARLLAPFGVRSSRPTGQVRGYRLADLEDAFARYLS